MDAAADDPSSGGYGELADLHRAMAAVADEPEPEAAPQAGARTACCGAHDRNAAVKDDCVTEPASGLRYRLLRPHRDETLEALATDVVPLKAAEKRMTMPPTSCAPFSTVGALGRRDAKETKDGKLFLKWRLTDLQQTTIVCFVFGAAANSLCQVRPGTVLLLQSPTWDDQAASAHAARALKVLDAASVTPLGPAVDMAICRGTTRKGERCSVVVNSTRSLYCDWHLAQAAEELKLRVRRECSGTLLDSAFVGASARVAQARVEGKRVRESWQDKLGRSTPQKLRKRSDGALKRSAEAYLSANAGSAGARALAAFATQQQEAAAADAGVLAHSNRGGGGKGGKGGPHAAPGSKMPTGAHKGGQSSHQREQAGSARKAARGTENHPPDGGVQRGAAGRACGEFNGGTRAAAGVQGAQLTASTRGGRQRGESRPAAAVPGPAPLGRRDSSQATAGVGAQSAPQATCAAGPAGIGGPPGNASQSPTPGDVRSRALAAMQKAAAAPSGSSKRPEARSVGPGSAPEATKPAPRLPTAQARPAGPQGHTTASAPQATVSRGAHPAPLTDFERMFGDALKQAGGSAAAAAGGGDGGTDVDMEGLADAAEWAMFKKQAEVLAVQEKVDEHKEAAKQMTVAALSCATCGMLCETPHPRCVRHNVKEVQVVKRWFRCGTCGRRTTTLSRRFPGHACDGCRMRDWAPCSMYGAGQDFAERLVNEMDGYAAPEHLKTGQGSASALG